MLSSLGKLPYTLCLYSLRLACALRFGKQVALWPRNSYLTTAFRPAYSDLDLSVLWQQEPKPKEQRWLLLVLRLTKKIFPALGECNVYCQSHWQFLDGLANPLELARDPYLQELRPQLPAPRSSAAETVWLLRMLEADLHNLQKRPETRVQKWNRHLQQVGQSLPKPISLEELLNCVFQNIPVDMRVKFLAACQWHWARQKEGLALHLQIERKDFPQELHVLWPQRFCFAPPRPLPQDTISTQIFLHQISWEIVGIYTQFGVHTQVLPLYEHMQKLATWLAAQTQMPTEQVTPLQINLQKLLSLLQSRQE